MDDSGREWTMETRNQHLADENRRLKQQIERFKKLNGHGQDQPFSDDVLPRPLTAEEFLTLDLPPRKMIIDPWLPEKGLVLLYSKRGVGKTHFGLSAAYAIASGAGFLGFDVPAPRKVLFIDGEMPGNMMQSRLAAIIRGSDKEPPDRSYWQILCADIIDGGLPDLATCAGQAAIDAALGAIEVIFLDNLSSLLRAGKENEAESWLPVQGWALAHRRAGRSIVFVHHAGKGGEQRGTSRREDLLDTILCLRHPADYTPDQGARFEVHFEKSRGFHGDQARAFEARYEERAAAALWTRTPIAEIEMQRVAALAADGLSIRDIAAELGMSKSAVGRLKRKNEASGKGE